MLGAGRRFGSSEPPAGTPGSRALQCASSRAHEQTSSVGREPAGRAAIRPGCNRPSQPEQRHGSGPKLAWVCRARCRVLEHRRSAWLPEAPRTTEQAAESIQRPPSLVQGSGVDAAQRANGTDDVRDRGRRAWRERLCNRRAVPQVALHMEGRDRASRCPVLGTRLAAAEAIRCRRSILGDTGSTRHAQRNGSAGSDSFPGVRYALGRTLREVQ